MKLRILRELDRATLIASACGLVLLLGISLAALRGLANVATVRDGLARAQQASLQINKLQAIVNGEQSAQRSLMLTGAEVAAETGRSAAQRFADLLQAVRVHARDNPSVLQEADKVAHLFAQRQAWSAETIRVYREQGPLAAARMIELDPAVVQFQVVRERIFAMHTALDDWLHARVLQASDVAKWLFLLIPLACLIGGLTLAAFLFSLNREASLRRRTEYQLAKERRRALTTVDALSQHVGIINSRGEIVAVNAAWRRYRLAHPGTGMHGVPGENCLEARGGTVGAADTGSIAPGSAWAAASIRAVLSDQTAEAELEYSCPGPGNTNWFLLRVTRLKGDEEMAAVISQTDISSRKQFEIDLAQNLVQLQTQHDELERFNRSIVGRELRMVELKQEVNALCAQLSMPPTYPMTAADKSWPA